MGLERLAYRVLIDMALGKSLSDAVVNDLTDGLRSRQRMGLHDVVAHAAIGALRYLQRADEAERTRLEYLKERRDGFTPSPTLFHLRPA